MPVLYHRSNSLDKIGDFLVPLNRDHGNSRAHSFVWFDEDLDRARKWNSCPLTSYRIYAVDSQTIPGLEPHPQWPGVWQTRQPVPFALADEVESEDRGMTLPGVLEDVRSRVEELRAEPGSVLSA